MRQVTAMFRHIHKERHMRTRLIRIGLGLSLCVGSFCGGDTQDTIAVIPKGTTHIFWKSVHAGAEKAAQELGVTVSWQGPQKEDDRGMQIQVVQNFISRNVDAIVLAPLDETALVRPVEAAVTRDIPVVIIDSDLKSDAHTSFVATDNRAGGRLAAERMAALLDSTGNVLVMRYAEGSASTTRREQGFIEHLQHIAPDITLVSTGQYGGVTAESAMQTAQNLLNKYDELQGIFCPYESTVFGMLRALQTAGRAGDITFVGFDASEPLLTGLRNGHIHGLVVQNPFKMGYLGVKTAVAATNGTPVDKRIDTGVTLVTAENIDEPGIQKIIDPDIDTWLDTAK
jgi:ribose transport system substrate-binding protein